MQNEIEEQKIMVFMEQTWTRYAMLELKDPSIHDSPAVNWDSRKSIEFNGVGALRVRILGIVPNLFVHSERFFPMHEFEEAVTYFNDL
jgi:hypothetical protein